jgi:hypothetical protein
MICKHDIPFPVLECKYSLRPEITCAGEKKIELHTNLHKSPSYLKSEAIRSPQSAPNDRARNHLPSIAPERDPAAISAGTMPSELPGETSLAASPAGPRRPPALHELPGAAARPRHKPPLHDLVGHRPYTNSCSPEAPDRWRPSTSLTASTSEAVASDLASRQPQHLAGRQLPAVARAADLAFPSCNAPCWPPPGARSTPRRIILAAPRGEGQREYPLLRIDV